MDQLEDVLIVPVNDSVCYQYYTELWRSMLTKDGSSVSSLQGLSIADTTLNRLCNGVMNGERSDGSVMDILSRLDVTIIRVS